MAVIKTIKKGSGVIRIHDDYCKDNTQEDNQRIVDECSRIILDYYRRKEANLARSVERAKQRKREQARRHGVALPPDAADRNKPLSSANMFYIT